MKINAALVLKLRNGNSWTQEELAIASGLNLKTIQRIEKKASASHQSKKALAAVFNIDAQDLDCKGLQMTPCPECRSEEVYQYEKYFEYTGVGEQLLPDLATGGTFSSTPICPVVCFECGYVRIYTSEESRGRLKASKHWRKV